MLVSSFTFILEILSNIRFFPNNHPLIPYRVGESMKRDKKGGYAEDCPSSPSSAVACYGGRASYLGVTTEGGKAVGKTTKKDFERQFPSKKKRPSGNGRPYLCFSLQP
jgi:hypothetical protein